MNDHDDVHGCVDHRLGMVRCYECARKCTVAFATAVRVASGRSCYVCARCIGDVSRISADDLEETSGVMGASPHGERPSAATQPASQRHPAAM